MIAKWIKFVFCWAESLIDTMRVECERNLSYPGVSGPYPAIAGYSWLSGYSRIQPDMGRYEAPRHVRSHRYSVLAQNVANSVRDERASYRLKRNENTLEKSLKLT